MRFHTLTLFTLFGISAWAQQAPEDAAVRQTLDRYTAAARRGDREAMAALLRTNAARFSTGGTRLGSPAGNPRGPSPDISKVSYFVRHVEFLGSDAAFAVGVWRNASAKAPYQNGAITYTLVKEGGVWKVATVHQTMAPAVPVLDAAVVNQPITRDG